eukprot:2195401-Pyramimonas_sp.AAC.1
MADNQVACRVIKAVGSTKFMHRPRIHRIDVAAISEQFTSGTVSLQCDRTQNEAADIGAKRFTDPLAWVKVLYPVNIVLP